ncbi:MAG TPA: DUF2177 family protein [Brevundimonas sp.]|nr:DUF2177 family protein [Brevundimonas sp.]
MRYLLAYVGAGVTMAVLDAIWLTTMADRLYRPVIGSIMADKPDMRPAIVFYLLYVFGIVFLAVLPGLREGSLSRTLTTAAVFGLVAYATYDLTNQATLRVWSTQLTLIDLAWGTVVTTAAALGGYLLARRFG